MTNMRLRKAPIIGEPSRVADVWFEVCKPDDPTSPKGSRTWNLLFDTDMQAGRARCMIAYRIRGEGVGNHFHPRVENKDPEIFVVLIGSVEFWFKDIYGEERTIPIAVNSQNINPVMIKIPPYLLHRINIVSPYAVFEEFQTGPFDPFVNYSAVEFELLRQQ